MESCHCRCGGASPPLCSSTVVTQHKDLMQRPPASRTEQVSLIYTEHCLRHSIPAAQTEEARGLACAPPHTPCRGAPVSRAHENFFLLAWPGPARRHSEKPQVPSKALNSNADLSPTSLDRRWPPSSATLILSLAQLPKAAGVTLKSSWTRKKEVEAGESAIRDYRYTASPGCLQNTKKERKKSGCAAVTL